MTEVNKDVNVPPMPEHIALTITCSLYEPIKLQPQVKMLFKN